MTKKTLFSLNLRGRMAEYDRPAVMAILNATPDSFYSAARGAGAEHIARVLAEGADMIDIGGCSTRPGAEEVGAEEEWSRIRPVLAEVRRRNADIPVSIDTFRAEVARRALAEGADIINDVSAGMFDADMARLIASTRAPYVIMHMRGTPATMQQLTDYSARGGVVADVITNLAARIAELSALGVNDIIVDPGFGFAKTVEQNRELLDALPLLVDTLQRPLLAGLSRKSMFYKPLGLTPADVLPATCAANLLAIRGGASILRVHDVAAARQIVDLFAL